MPDTIDGGAYIAADGKTWVDSEGKPIKADQVAAAKKLAAERAEELSEVEHQNVLRAAARDPIARALTEGQLTRRAAPVAPAPARGADK